jgi:hypothetical protein
VEVPIASLVLFAGEGRLCPQGDKKVRRRSSERPYHRPKARRLQRDVQLTGPLAVGQPSSLESALEMLLVEDLREVEDGAAMAAAAGRADRLSWVCLRA